jgi:hypothetical protein
MKEQRKILGLMNRGERVGNGDIIINKGALKADKFIINIRKNRSHKLVTILYIKMENFTLMTKRHQNRTINHCRHLAHQQYMDEEKHNQEENSEILLKDLKQLCFTQVAWTCLRDLNSNKKVINNKCFESEVEKVLWMFF